MKAFFLAILSITVALALIVWFVSDIGPAHESGSIEPVAHSTQTAAPQHTSLQPADEAGAQLDDEAVDKSGTQAGERAPVEPAALAAAPVEQPATGDARPGHTIGRLIGPDGEPLVATAYNAFKEAWYVDRNNMNGRGGTTDDAGRFDIEWHVGADDELQNAVFFRSDREGTAPLISARRFIEGPLVREVDLGDVLMTPAPRLVAGTVVDQAGAPVQRAKVHVATVMSAAELAERGWSAKLSTLRPQGRAMTDASGAFEIWAERLETADHFLVAEAAGHRQLQPQAFQPGEAGVDLRLHRMGAIAGTGADLGPAANEMSLIAIPTALSDSAAARALLESRGTYSPEERIWERIGVAEDDSSDAPTEQVDRETQLQELWSERNQNNFLGFAMFSSDDAFFIDKLWPGIYRVEILRGEELVLAIDDVVVRAGETPMDPRLFEFVLPQAAQWLELYVFNSVGRRIDDAVAWDLASARRPLSPAQVESGRLRLSIEPDAYRVSAPGYLATEFKTLAGKHKVTLAEAPTLTFTLPKGVAPPAGEEWLVGLMPKVPGKQVQDDWWDAFLVPIRKNQLTGQYSAFVTSEALGPCHLLRAKRVNKQLTLVSSDAEELTVEKSATHILDWPVAK